MRNPGILILFTVLMAGLVILPAGAATYTPTNNIVIYETREIPFLQVYSLSYDASADNERVSLVSFTIPSDSQVDFTLYYGNGSTVTGSSENHHINLLQTSSTVTLGGVSKEYTYIDTQPFYDFNFAGYAEERDILDPLNQTARTGFLVYSINYGALDNDLAVFFEVPNPAINTIYRVDASSTKQFDMWVRVGAAADVSGGVSKDILEIAWEWINSAIALSSFVLDLVLALFAWLKFFFVDNLLMTVALYLSITMAYSACTAKNIFTFFGKFFNDQRKLFEFILGLWKSLIEILASFRGIFRI